MRKLIWGCTALVVASGGFYLAAEFAARHPESVVEHSAVVACGVTTCAGPVLRATEALLGLRNSGNGVDEEDRELVLDDIPADPEPVSVQEAEGSIGAEPVAAAQPAAIDTTQGRLPGRLIIADSQEPTLAAKDTLASPPQDYDLEAIAKRLDGEVLPEEAPAHASLPERTPHCTDEDRAPSVMPYAQDEEKPEIGFWRGLWKALVSRSETVGGQEDCEPPPLNRPPDCREDPTYPHQCPGCPHSDCREPRVCPYCGKSAPADEEVQEVPQPKKPARQPNKATPKGLWDIFESVPIERPSDVWREKGRPGVDTMEFRPSDWGKDDVPLPPF
jgi:hypothetical protein